MSRRVLAVAIHLLICFLVYPRHPAKWPETECRHSKEHARSRSCFCPWRHAERRCAGPTRHPGGFPKGDGLAGSSSSYQKVGLNYCSQKNGISGKLPHPFRKTPPRRASEDSKARRLQSGGAVASSQEPGLSFHGLASISFYLYTSISMYVCMYIYIYMVTPPTTRTPSKNTVNIDTNAVFSESNFGAVSTDWKHKCETQRIPKSKSPKIQKSKNLKIQNFSHLGNLVFLEFWSFGFCVF